MRNSHIALALKFAAEDGQVDGAHHKMWVIDQMVRALTNCPIVTRSALDYQGKSYQYECQGESDAYCKFVSDVGEWDKGIAP